MKPTHEQTAAMDAFRAGDHLALQAGAGTGKTTLLEMLAAPPHDEAATSPTTGPSHKKPPPGSPAPSSAKPPTHSPTPPSATATRAA